MIDLTFWFLGFHDIQEFEFSDSLQNQFTFQSLFQKDSQKSLFPKITFKKSHLGRKSLFLGLNKEKP